MRAFHNSEEIKQKYLDRVKNHRQADELIKRTGWDGSKGCAVGCTLEKYSHEAYEKELGIPQILARLEDVIFENLPKKEAMLWPERFLSAIPIGADLSLVTWKFLYQIVENCVIKCCTPNVVESCGDAIRVLHKIASGEKVDEVEAKNAARAIESAENAGWFWQAKNPKSTDKAACSEAWSAAYSAAATATASATRAAWWAVCSAAATANATAAWGEACSAAASAAIAAWRVARTTESSAMGIENNAWVDMAEILEKLIHDTE